MRYLFTNSTYVSKLCKSVKCLDTGGYGFLHCVLWSVYKNNKNYKDWYNKLITISIKVCNSKLVNGKVDNNEAERKSTCWPKMIPFVSQQGKVLVVCVLIRDRKFLKSSKVVHVQERGQRNE